MLSLILAACISAAEPAPIWSIAPPDLTRRYRNPDGSCVYCSIGIAGVHHLNDNAAQILWNSKYGHACRGGSNPNRVQHDANRRQLPIWNVEGDTWPWIEWALRSNRYVAVTLTPEHMQTAVAISNDGNTVYVIDNNSPTKVTPWSRDRFLREHTRHGGGWAVILQGPKPLPWSSPQRPAAAYRRGPDLSDQGYLLE